MKFGEVIELVSVNSGSAEAQEESVSGRRVWLSFSTALNHCEISVWRRSLRVQRTIPAQFMDHRLRRRYVNISIRSACFHEYVYPDTRHKGRGSCTHCSGTELGPVYMTVGVEKLQADPVAKVAPNESSKGDKNDSEKDQLDLKVRRFPHT